MSNNSITRVAGNKWQKRGAQRVWLARLMGLVLGCSSLLIVAGCKSTSGTPTYDSTPAAHSGLSPDEQKALTEATREPAKNVARTTPAPVGTNAPSSDSIVLREGDTVRLSFPGAPNLNVVQAIRRDGKLSLQLVGEIQAAGKTPTGLEKDLIDLYGPQLQVKEVTVTMESSAFPVYVTGAVLRPGKFMSDRPLSALEAIMEAGGFDFNRANLKTIRIIRNNEGRTDHYQLNLKEVIDGKKGDTFKLNPSDIIYVPERFSWF